MFDKNVAAYLRNATQSCEVMPSSPMRLSQSPQQEAYNSIIKSNIAIDSGETCRSIILVPCHAALVRQANQTLATNKGSSNDEIIYRDM